LASKGSPLVPGQAPELLAGQAAERQALAHDAPEPKPQE
jgi:hypothetical protein